MRRTNIYLSETQWRELEKLSKKNLSISELIQRFIDEGLKKLRERRGINERIFNKIGR